MLKRYVLIVLFCAVWLVLPALSAFACDYCILSTGISPLDTIKGERGAHQLALHPYG